MSVYLLDFISFFRNINLFFLIWHFNTDNIIFIFFTFLVFSSILLKFNFNLYSIMGWNVYLKNTFFKRVIKIYQNPCSLFINIFLYFLKHLKFKSSFSYYNYWIIKDKKNLMLVHVWIVFMAGICAFCWKNMGLTALFTDL